MLRCSVAGLWVLAGLLVARAQIDFDAPFGTVGGSLVLLATVSETDIPAIGDAVLGDVSSLVAIGMFSPVGVDVADPWQIPSELGLATSLVIFFAQVLLAGTLPSQLGQLTALQILDFPDNALEGTVPTELGALTNLDELRLNTNNLEGSVPSQLGRLTNLLGLHLHSTALSGPLPSEIGRLTSLRALYISRTRLAGVLPSQLAALTNLQLLQFDDTDLWGALPVQLVTSGELRTVSAVRVVANASRLFPAAADVVVADSSLGGSWPDIGSAAKLTDLRLPRCGLEGTLPSQIGNFGALRHLAAEGNSLVGAVPSQIGLLSHLTALELQGNAVDGIPTELGLLPLAYLTLDSNALSGSVPDAIFGLSGLLVLGLHHNALTGSIRSQLGRLVQLETLCLNNNRLSGTLPTELALLVRLHSLFVQSNQLEGAVPQGLQQLAALSNIALSDNRFRGKIEHGRHREWLADCDDSGLDEHACSYTCPPCAARKVTLVPCNWKGQNRRCARVATLGAASCGVVVLSMLVNWALLGKVGKVLLFRVALTVASALRAALEVLFVLGTSGLVSRLALGNFALRTGLHWLGALLFLVPRRREFQTWLFLCSVVMLGFDRNVLEAASRFAGAKLPLYVRVGLLALGIFESFTAGILQLLVIQQGGASKSTKAAFAASVLSFSSLVIVGLVLVLSHLRGRGADRPGEAMVEVNPCRPHRGSGGTNATPEDAVDRQDSEMGGIGGSNARPSRATLRSEHGEEGDVVGEGEENEESGGEGKGEEGHGDGNDECDQAAPLARRSGRDVSQHQRRRSTIHSPGARASSTKRSRWRWMTVSLLCCACAMVVVQLPSQFPRAVPAPPLRASALAPAATLPRTRPLQQRASFPKPAPVCGAGLFSVEGPLVCVFGTAFALVEAFGELQEPLSSLIVSGGLDGLQFVQSSSQFPSEIGLLWRLQVLTEEGIGGALPTELGLLSSLRFLEMSDHHGGIALPSEVGRLSALELLQLRHATVLAIPSQWGGLASLHTLDFSSVNFPTDFVLRSELGQLANLTTLSIRGGALRGLPTEIGHLGALVKFTVVAAGLQGTLPTQLGLLSGLTGLFVQGNAVRGQLPAHVLRTPTLQFLDASANRLSGTLFPQSGWNPPPNLRFLGVEDNQLSGSIPSQLGLATKLERLALSGNDDLGGTLPSQLGRLTRLTSLRIERCAFEGKVPSQLARLTLLREVLLQLNHLEGRLPKEFDQAQRSLWLSECDYSGLGNTECARYCPGCATYELRVRGCDHRGHHNACLAFQWLVFLAGGVGCVMHLVLRKETGATLSRTTLVWSLLGATVATMHLVLDLFFIAHSTGAIFLVSAVACSLAVLLRLVVAADELLGLQTQGHVSLAEKAKKFSLALLFCVVDPVTVEVFLAARGKQLEHRQLVLVRFRILVTRLTNDVPMLCVQLAALASSPEPTVIQALCLTMLSLVGTFIVAWRTSWRSR